MEIDLELSLPREANSVPVVRHLCRSAMQELGVDHDCCDAVEIALSEACTNVLKHSGPGDEYQVGVTVDEERCTIRVVDHGQGLDSSTLGEPMAGNTAERGRGVAIMEALVDRVKFELMPENGTIVHLEKNLQYDDSAPLKLLLNRDRPAPQS